MSVGMIFPPLLVFEIPLLAILLTEVGLDVVVSTSSIMGSQSLKKEFLNCDIVFKTKNGVTVGINQLDSGGIELVCDEIELENVEGISKSNLKKDLTKKYTHRKITDELAKHGFSIVEETVQNDQTVKIRVRRWS